MQQARNGRRYPSKQYQIFKPAVLDIIGDPEHTFTGAVKITCEFVMPDRRERDTSNYLKCLYDSIEAAGVFKKSDCQILKEEHWKKLDSDGKICFNKQGGWVDVVIEDYPKAHYNEFVEIDDES